MTRKKTRKRKLEVEDVEKRVAPFTSVYGEPQEVDSGTGSSDSPGVVEDPEQMPGKSGTVRKDIFHRR